MTRHAPEGAFGAAVTLPRTRPDQEERVTEIVNLTPHPLRLYGPDCPDRIDSVDAAPVNALYPAGEKPVRLATIDLGRQTSYPPIDLVEYGYVHDLPAQRDGVWLVVPLVVALGARHRADLLAPYCEVRNAEGTVIGCRAFQRAV